ncbi:DUF1835 domain-containing protein [Thermasporomyces composti]|uniref:Uncharacterized protein DUF1835 n=1 Tax=Thermasporomyces composti TaxID=696763 RepID=A0A3D9V111_THECX|nr:DUF1835 domain-containing protein [Thermasporomyces composti]REF35159.1 uncharacterized protein DUF1835 [Thermasporomyces composti]
MLHITNGDVAADRLREAGVEEPILPWRDVLHDGPVPAGLSDTELAQVRAAFLARQGSVDDEQAILRDLQVRDDTLRRLAGEPILLWFEADLYDQLQILQVLDRLRRLDVDPSTVTLVCVGEHPGLTRFLGLGQLEPRALLSLREQARPLTPDAFDAAEAGWAAFTAPEPRDLAAMARGTSASLPYLGEAFGRLMREYPGVSDGLSLTQRRILAAVEAGAGTMGEVFRWVGEQERRPYLGDRSCFAVMTELATCPEPLLTLGDDDTEEARAVQLTPAGRDVLDGRRDHLALNGVNRWIGGVHLTDPETAWRYDERRETLTPPR